MQLQADLLGVPVARPRVTETTALGAAYLAGIGVGLWAGEEEVAAQWRLERRFEPGIAAAAVSYTHLDVYKRQTEAHDCGSSSRAPLRKA